MCIRFGKRFAEKCPELVTAVSERLRRVDRCRYLGVYFSCQPTTSPVGEVVGWQLAGPYKIPLRGPAATRHVCDDEMASEIDKHYELVVPACTAAIVSSLSAATLIVSNETNVDTRRGSENTSGRNFRPCLARQTLGPSQSGKF